MQTQKIKSRRNWFDSSLMDICRSSHRILESKNHWKKMEPTAEKIQMDEYLMTIQREAKAALDGFDRSGLTIDSGFLNNFMKQSFDW